MTWQNKNINPNYSGGEIAYENAHEGCTIAIRVTIIVFFSFG